MLTVGPSMSTRRIRAFYAILDRLQGRSVVQRFDEALARQALSREALLRAAEERLREQLEYAAREVPFYAGRLDAFARGGGSEAAFAAIPPLEKTDIAAGARVVARARPVARGCRRHRGDVRAARPDRRPASLLDRDTVDAHAAAALRTFLWWGADPTRRHAMLWGCPTEENTYLQPRRAGCAAACCGRTLLRPATALDRDGRARIFERVAPHLARPRRRLLERAREVGAAARPGEAPRVRAGVVAAAEPIFDFQRPLVERGVRRAALDRYGCNEFSAIAHGCRAGGLHVAIDRVRLDVVREDGTPAAHGEIGSVLVTDLDNRHMPLVRYRIGDLAALRARLPLRAALPDAPPRLRPRARCAARRGRRAPHAPRLRRRARRARPARGLPDPGRPRPAAARGRTSRREPFALGGRRGPLARRSRGPVRAVVRRRPCVARAPVRSCPCWSRDA